MTVKEFIGTLESSDRLRIIEGKAEVYVGYEIRSIYEQLRTAGVPVREMITVQQRVISW